LKALGYRGFPLAICLASKFVPDRQIDNLEKRFGINLVRNTISLYP
jgi:hypothetical protein